MIGAVLFLGGGPGLVQLARNAVQSITSFSLTPIPFFVLMGKCCSTPASPSRRSMRSPC